MIDETIEVILNPTNMKWYKEKGYEIPKIKDKWGVLRSKRGTTINVRIEDLSNGSNVYIRIKCHNCKKDSKIRWADYIECLENNHEYHCKKCALKLYGSDNGRITKLKTSISFEQWCYDNLIKEEADRILLRWDYENNIDKYGGIIKPTQVSYCSHGFNDKGYWFKCLKHPEHESELKNIKSFVTSKKKTNMLCCSQCNSFAQWGIDNIDKHFLEKYWSNKNELLGINPWHITRRCSEKVWIICQEKDYHEDYKITCDSFVGNDRCPCCCNFHGKVHPRDSLGQYIIDNYSKEFLDSVWSNKNTKSSFEYTPKSHIKVWWKCPEGKHEDYYRIIQGSNTYDFRCAECVRERDESFLQEKVRLYLNKLGYTVLHEYKCNILPINPKTNYPLPFDNEVVELKLVIEVHGSQHYKELSGMFFNPNFDLHKRKLYDRYKKFIAYIKGYKYLVVPYTSDNKKRKI